MLERADSGLLVIFGGMQVYWWKSDISRVTKIPPDLMVIFSLFSPLSFQPFYTVQPPEFPIMTDMTDAVCHFLISGLFWTVWMGEMTKVPVL